MRKVILALLVGLVGCDDLPPPRTANSPPSPMVVRPAESQVCVKREIQRRVSEVWAAPAAAGEFPPSVTAPDKKQSGRLPTLDEIPTAALEKCIPLYQLGTKYTSSSRVQAFANATYYAARQKYLSQIIGILRDRESKKTAEDQASLTRGEPDVMNDYHNCLFVGADGMGLVSDEPAEAVVATVYAACRPLRTAVVELHKRYGDAAFNDQIMDRVEAGVTGTLILEVIRIREAVPAPASPDQPPSLPTPP
jgi:hypothetical protein